MYIKQDLDFNNLMDNCWSSAIDTLKTIEENNKEDELMSFLEEQWLDEIPTITEVNDFLRFENEFIFECLGICEDEENEEDLSNYENFNDLCLGRDCKNCPLWHYSGECEEIFEKLKAEQEE